MKSSDPKIQGSDPKIEGKNVQNVQTTYIVLKVTKPRKQTLNDYENMKLVGLIKKYDRADK